MRNGVIFSKVSFFDIPHKNTGCFGWFSPHSGILKCLRSFFGVSVSKVGGTYSRAPSTIEIAERPRPDSFYLIRP